MEGLSALWESILNVFNFLGSIFSTLRFSLTTLLSGMYEILIDLFTFHL